VRIGSNVCISQQVFLCAAGHDYRDPAFSYRNAPILIGSGVWLQARVFVCPGVSIGDEAVVTACSFVKHDLPSNYLCTGNPALPEGPALEVILVPLAHFSGHDHAQSDGA
jgi:putative colanic acid biosynthesis acetyltransferase WcaF